MLMAMVACIRLRLVRVCYRLKILIISDKPMSELEFLELGEFSEF